VNFSLISKLEPALSKAWPVHRSQRRFRSSKRNGFTLVELLVVLAIITILVAILVPVLWSVRNQALNTACATNLQNLGKAIQIYADDYDGTLPDAPGTPVAGTVDINELPYSGLFPSGRVPRTLRPSQSTYVWNQLRGTDSRLAQGIFECPLDQGEKEFGYDRGPVYESALTSYLWDPAQLPSVQDALGGKPLQPVNGESVAMLDDPAESRLLQDYGAGWHKGFAPAQSGKIRGMVNTVFADGHVHLVPSLAPQTVETASNATSDHPGSAQAETIPSSSQGGPRL
jgi:prepilin-type N-terminal cleavage/methylation domain-containing protein/prepilin-type processing-associated H-X9-DG protein